MKRKNENHYLVIAAMKLTAIGCAAPVDAPKALSEPESAASTAEASSDDIVKLTRADLMAALDATLPPNIEGRVVNVMEFDPGRADRYTLTRYNDLEYGVELHLVAIVGPHNFLPMIAEFFIEMAPCNWKKPSVALKIRGITYGILDPWNVLNGTQRELIREVFDVNSNYGHMSWTEITSDLNAALSDAFARKSMNRAKPKACPDVTTDSHLTMSIDFTPGTECPNDETTKHVACQPPARGDGDAYVCRNGYWIWASHDCVNPPPPPTEPKPPGGAQP